MHSSEKIGSVIALLLLGRAEYGGFPAPIWRFSDAFIPFMIMSENR
jgi:hypothetical protein